MIEVLNFGVKVEVEWQWIVVGKSVDLGQDIYVWEIHLEHGAQGKEDVGDVEGWLGKAEAIGQVDGY